MKAAGPVFTVRGRPDATLDKHTSLYEWAGLLSRAPRGHVVVCQPQDDTRALFGGLSAEALAIKGVRGYIVDGGCRDVQAIADQGFPVFARFNSPIDIVGAWRAEAYADLVHETLRAPLAAPALYRLYDGHNLEGTGRPMAWRHASVIPPRP